jgi:nicotinamide-nucleotide amidase
VRAELVAIGSELLLGEYADANSAWVSARLAEIGVEVARHTAVGDDVAAIGAVLRDACARAETVIVTGGLGPTQDDLTRVAVAQVAAVDLERRPELEEALYERFARMGREMPLNNLLQADIPAGARVIDAVGTAPGFAVRVGSATVYCLPGVPSEMRVMVDRDVLPDVARRAGAATTVTRVVRTAGMAESAVAETCADLCERLNAAGNPVLAFLASKGETRVKVTARAASRDEALALCDPVVAELLDLLSANVAGVDDEGVEAAIARQLGALGWTLAVAESVTGGGVSARLVRIAGASAWFRGALVTYATDVKASLAGVAPSLLKASGPVSEPTAIALARGACARLEADVGLAVVGVAGPATQGGEPVGTVCVAVTLPDGAARARTVRVPAQGREVVQEFAVSVACDYLRRRLAAVS